MSFATAAVAPIMLSARYPLSHAIPGVYRRQLAQCKHLDLLEALCRKGLVQRCVTDVNAFVKGIDAVVQQPYARTLFGESDRECLALRDEVATFTKLEDAPPKKYAFAAWTLWQQRKGKVYIGSSVIRAFCGGHGLDVKQFMHHLHVHPDNKNFYTYVELHVHEQNVRKWIEGATCLRGEAALAALERGPGGASDKLDDVQNGVLRSVLATPFSCVQGGAGVGKTTTVAEIIRRVRGGTVATVTFTHKAKRCVEKRLDQAGISGVATSTIHAFIQRLKSMRGARLFLLVDESSMVDLELMGELARAVMEACDAYQLCFVGDEMQLPSVGRGEIYRAMVESGRPWVHSLTRCYRTDHPDLFEAYQKIRAGVLPEPSDNFSTHLFDDDAGVDRWVAAFVKVHRADYMYVAWQNKDVVRVNRLVQDAMLKAGRVGPAGWGGFYEGDRVVYRGENKDGLTNAMTGAVDAVQADGMTVRWDDADAARGQQDLTAFKGAAVRDVQLVYCGTCHILQGSEYPRVCVLGYDIPKMTKCSDRKWLYTAATRAQSCVVLASTAELRAFVESPIADAPMSGLRF